MLNVTNTLAGQYQQIFICPITIQMMKNPYDLPCGHTFEFSAIEEVIMQYRQCPICRTYVTTRDLRKNLFAKQVIALHEQNVKKEQQKLLNTLKKVQNDSAPIRVYHEPQIELNKNYPIFAQTTISGLKKRTQTIYVMLNDSIKSIQEKIINKYKQEGQNAFIIMRYGLKTLNEDLKIKDYGILEHCTIQVEFRVRNSQKQAESPPPNKKK